MIRRIRNKRLNESTFTDSDILGMQELKDFCNEIIDAFEEDGISCDVEWHANGTGDIFLWGDYERVLAGRVVLVHDVEKERGYVYVRNNLNGETKQVGKFYGDLDFGYGADVWSAFDPVDVEEAIGRREPDDYDESVKRCNIRSNQKKEGVVIGAADDGIAENIEIVIRNEYSLYKGMQALVDSLVKKASKGVNLDKDKLAKSSVVDQLVRQAIRYLQKEDHEGDNEGIFDYISTATRNLAKEYVTNTILNKVEDDIRYNNRK